MTIIHATTQYHLARILNSLNSDRQGIVQIGSPAMKWALQMIRVEYAAGEVSLIEDAIAHSTTPEQTRQLWEEKRELWIPANWVSQGSPVIDLGIN